MGVATPFYTARNVGRTAPNEPATAFGYDGALHMKLRKNAASSLLMASGVVLTFVGLSSALGFTPGGMLASVAAIAALLYAGGIWFGRPVPTSPAGAATIIVFDRTLRIVTRRVVRIPCVGVVPRSLRAEIETHCEAALRGEPSHFVCEHEQDRFVFDVAPVQNIAGVVLLGVLISGSVAVRDDVESAAAFGR